MTGNAPRFTDAAPQTAPRGGAADRAARVARGLAVADAFRADLAAGRFDFVETAYSMTLAEFAASRGERLRNYERDEIEAVLGRIVHGMSSSRATRSAVGKVSACATRVREGQAHNARIQAAYAQAKTDGTVTAHEVRTPIDLGLLRHRAQIRRLLRRERAARKRQAADITA